MHAETAPPSLIVLGGGPIGCELGQAFARFGSKVTVVANGPQLLPREEPEAGEVLADVFRREGIDVRLNASTARVSAGGDGVELSLADGGTVTGTKLLVAAGRTPNLHDIGLSSIGLDDKARSLTVDEHMRVLLDDDPVDRLYAIGDIAGHGAFTHLSIWQARVLVAHLMGEHVHRSRGWPRREDGAGGTRRRTVGAHRHGADLVEHPRLDPRAGQRRIRQGRRRR
jgi:pyruvate/2-oxoglutarate dehydrogenase complex dihydrolipoamide dehydrogenase (E3) component